MVVPLGALIAIAAARARRAPLLVAGLAIVALATLANAGLGVYHAGVEWRFWQGPTACTGPVGNLGSAGSLLERLDTVKVVRCDEVQWQLSRAVARRLQRADLAPDGRDRGLGRRARTGTGDPGKRVFASRLMWHRRSMKPPSRRRCARF